MIAVLTGFGTIAIVIVVGMALAHLRILDDQGQELLSKLAFTVANPALMIVTIGRANVHQLFSTHLVASVSGVVVTALIELVVSALVFRRKAQEVVIGTFCSSYVNASNLGVPIASYVIGNTAVVAPMLLTQLLVLQPAGLAVLDVLNARSNAVISRRQVIRVAILRPIRNPITVASLIGVLLSVTGWQPPHLIMDPIALIGNLAVPAMLLAYGVSLRTGPLPGRGESPVQLGVITVLKLVVQPAVAWAVGYFALGITGLDLLAITVIAALPTAQNVFIFATRYRAGVVLARDAIFINTLASVPVILAISALVT